MINFQKLWSQALADTEGETGLPIKEFGQLVETQARNQALEEAAAIFDRNDTNLFWGSQAAVEIRALKDVYANTQNLDTSEQRVQIIHDSMHEAIQPDIEGHPV